MINYSNYLPQQSKNQMGLAYEQVVSVNVDDITANGTRRVQG